MTQRRCARLAGSSWRSCAEGARRPSDPSQIPQDINHVFIFITKPIVRCLLYRMLKSVFLLIIPFCKDFYRHGYGVVVLYNVEDDGGGRNPVFGAGASRTFRHQAGDGISCVYPHVRLCRACGKGQIQWRLGSDLWARFPDISSKRARTEYMQMSLDGSCCVSKLKPFLYRFACL